MKFRVFSLLIGIVLFACCKSSLNEVNSNSDKPYLIMLSMDGFRWDYPEKANTPSLDNIEKVGVRVESCVPCFPTKTFPNHYSMATGLYPENHGLIFNRFYATDLGKFYSVGNRESVGDSSFYFGEPIWVTAEKQGIRSASYFWVGSEALHDNLFPTYHYDYNGSVPFEDRLDGVIKWLKLPEEERPHLILWYMQEPDGIGHYAGPNHQETIQVIEYLDSLVGVFYNKVAELEIAEQVNVIITSDHGMGEISEERTVYFDDYINKNWIEYLDGANPAYSIEAKEEFYDTLYSTLSRIDNIKVWKKEEVPARLHFSKSERIKDFVVVADSSWSLLVSGKKKAYSGGAHGYDNINKDMHAIFYAYGPAFKEGYKHNSINNIDIYALICEILDLDPAKNDGELENVIPLLN